ncbi:MAG: molybdate ABC transporter substrate-binding protein [Sulfurospirillaceae bacterium]|nr:molybdate ABC transporter substrate-binding protein [Sulfurospirillaceae bacterium]
MFKKSIIASLFLSVSVFAGTINIAVAANVSYAMGALKSEFNKLYPNIKVQVTLSSSGKLTAQIKNGAPYGLFMAANMKYPQALYKSGDAITRPLIYAQGSLAYLSTKKQDFSKGINLLKEKQISKIAVANPKTAPYGKAAIQAMKKGDVYDSIKNKLVYAESISQTVSYTISATDIGFIAKSSLFSPKMAKYKKGINWSDVDPKLYTPINQGIVILKNGEKNSEIAAFYGFILSKRAKKIFNDFGYAVP